MVTVDYQQSDFCTAAWAALDRREPLDVIIPGWRVEILRRCLPLWMVSLGPTPRRTTYSEICRMAVCGFPLAWLMGVYNHALFQGWRRIGSSEIAPSQSRSGPAY
jgi:hypothetical protein